MSVGVLQPGCLEGQVAVVTGAGSGLGRAIALRLLALGASVVGMGRRVERLEETRARAGEHAERYFVRPVDLRDAASLDAVAQAVAEEHAVSLLVNNAGGQFVAPATEISRRGWQAVIDLNLTAVFRLCQAFRESLARASGAIVNISLSPVERGALGMAHGVAARAGVLGLTRSLALEWAPAGIRINCIGPGSVETEALGDEVGVRNVARLVSGIPLGRLTRPEEVAELVGFLASPAGALMSGQLFHVDGLAHLGPPVDLLALQSASTGGERT